jgi:hypothetical protein
MVEWLIMNADGWDRAGQRSVLAVLDAVHKILLQNETSQSQKFDASRGDFPSFPTIAGVYEYLMPTNVWRVSEVLLPFPLSPDYGFSALLPDYNYIKHVRQVDVKEYFHKRYVRMPNVTAIDKTESSGCKVRFHDDPGDKIEAVSSGVNSATNNFKLIHGAATFITNGVRAGHGVINSTDKTISEVVSVDSETQLTIDRNIFTGTGKSYKVGPSTIMYKGYLEAPILSSESIQMGGNDKFHMEILLPATLQFIEAFENGGWVEASEMVSKKYKPMMINEQNEGEQGLTYKTAPHEA